jgi:hypothetical protein
MKGLLLMPLAACRSLVVPVLAAAVLLVTGCGSEPTGETGPTPPAAPSGAAQPGTGPPSSAARGPSTQQVRVSYANGEVSGDTGRVAVPLGSTVSLTVSGDSADQVHVHGYGRKVEVPAGGSATLTFTADIPGVFEVELHDAGLLLTQLEVS